MILICIHVQIICHMLQSRHWLDKTHRLKSLELIKIISINGCDHSFLFIDASFDVQRRIPDLPGQRTKTDFTSIRTSVDTSQINNFSDLFNFLKLDENWFGINFLASLKNEKFASLPIFTFFDILKNLLNFVPFVMPATLHIFLPFLPHFSYSLDFRFSPIFSYFV